MFNLRSVLGSDPEVTYNLLPTDEDSQSPGDGDGVTIHMREKVLRRSLGRPRPEKSLFLTLLAGVVLGVVLGATAMFIVDPAQTWTASQHGKTTLAPESPSRPRAVYPCADLIVPLTTVVFEERPELVDPPTDENQKYWDGLLPLGRGFVNISNPEEYGLEPGIPTDSGVDRYSVAMFHQLHCLGLLRFAYWRLMDAMSGNWTDAEREREFQKQVHDHHTQHCFAYVTESIKCSADLTIEWARIEKDGTRKQVDGWGIPHQCKDPEKILMWVESIHGPTKGGDVHLHSLTGMKQSNDKAHHP